MPWGNVGLWAISGEERLNHLTPQAGVPIINGDNLKGLYSFHPGGSQVAYSDGGVRFLQEGMESAALLAQVSREEQEPNP